jgi:hypothetical protein
LAKIQVFKNGVLVPACSGPAGVASPDPCVSARAMLSGGDVAITVLTSTASDWLSQASPTRGHDGIGTVRSWATLAQASLFSFVS